MVTVRSKTTKKKNLFGRLPIITKGGHRADFTLLFVVLMLSVFGLIMVYDASIVEANEQFGDRFHYLKFQTAYFVLGWIGLLLLGRIDYHIYKKGIRWLFLGNLFFLLLVLIPGIGLQIKGVRRWIDLGITTFQPTEPFKTILVLYLASWLEKNRTLPQFAALVLFVLGLVILEPDLGSSIVLVSTMFVIYYIQGAPMMKFALSSIAAFFLGLILIVSSPYRRQRLTTFLDSSSDITGSSYHIQQVIISLGSGGILGLGIGQSKQKYQYVPEAMTDSIVAIVGEELGFIGTVGLILLFMTIIWKGFKIAQNAPDMYGRLVATGITVWISVQMFLNLASMVSLVPLTGVPLPFMSYGGTSLVVTLFSIGILLNISKQTVNAR